MQRRSFIRLVGGAVIWPLTAHAQQGEQIRRIGAIIGYARNDPEVLSPILMLLIRD